MGWPDLTYRSRLEPQLRNELDQLVSLIIGWNAAEHGADGQHTTITVDGIQFRHADGAIFATITVGESGIVITYTPTSPPAVDPTITLPTAQISDVLVGHHHGVPGGTFSHNAGIDLNTDAPPDIGGKWLVGVGRDGFANALIFANYAAAGNIGEGIALYWLGATGYLLSPPAAGSVHGYYLGSTLDSRLRWNGVATHAMDALLGYHERGRAVPMGEWIDIPYNAANFYTLTSQVWTVDASDVGTYRYTLIGKTMTVALSLASTVLSGPPGPYIFVALPPGLVSARDSQGTGWAFLNGAYSVFSLTVQAGLGRLTLYGIFVGSTPSGVWPSVPDVHIAGSITFEIQ